MVDLMGRLSDEEIKNLADIERKECFGIVDYEGQTDKAVARARINTYDKETLCESIVQQMRKTRD